MRKVNLMLFVVSVFMTKGFAQLQDCGTITLGKEEMSRIEDRISTFSNIQSTGITYLPVKLHLTRNTYEGTSYYSVSQFMFEFAKLNEKFEPLGFQFYLADSINYINGYTLDDFDSPYYVSDSLALVANNVNDAINLYYVNNSNVGGRSNFISGDKFYNWMFVKNGNFQQGETLIHEMGHYFNLYHTFETYQGAELVNGSNCATAGDLVCDTPADPRPNTYDKMSCVYTGLYTDGNGQTYTPNMTNYMSYYSGGCIQDFTPGQMARAQAAHVSRLSLISNEGNQYNFNYPSNDTITVSHARAFEHNSQLKIRWFAYSSPIGFLIERSTSPSSGFVAIGGVQGHIREFSDPDYEAGMTYYYRVKAANSKMNYSNMAIYSPAKDSYAHASNYSDHGFPLRWIRFYNASNTSSLYISASKASDDFNDFASYGRYVKAGQKYRFNWESWSGSTYFFKVWIDFNQNNVFESSEKVVEGNGDNGTDSLELASNIKTGYYRIRFRGNYENDTFGPNDRQIYSSTYDYLLYIDGACAGQIAVIDYLYQSVVSGEAISTTDYTILYPDPFSGYPVNLSAPSVTLNPGFLADGYNVFTADTNGCP